MRYIVRSTLPICSLLLLLGGCASRTLYEPAMPAERVIWDNTPLVPITPPPPELVAPQQAPVDTSVVPPTKDWESLQEIQAPKHATRSGRKRIAAARPAPSTIDLQARPIGTAMLSYPWRMGHIYTVMTAPQSPTYLLLPPGERLAASPAVNGDLWVIGMVQMGKGDLRQEAVIVRPVQAGQETTTALMLQSGVMIFIRLVSTEKTATVSVAWSLPQPEAAPEPTPVAHRAPKIDVGRLWTGYSIQPTGKLIPPWMPVAVFDDGTRTYVQFREALTYTRAPGIVGLAPQGDTALVQSRMYTVPDQPERGAWLVIQGLWPALELKDSAQLMVRILRKAPQAQPLREIAHAP